MAGGFQIVARWLENVFKTFVSSVWLAAVALTADDLSREDQMELDFIFSGLTSIFGQAIHDPTIPQPPAPFQRKLGAGILATLNRLRGVQKQQTIVWQAQFDRME